MDATIKARLERIYAALGLTVDQDVTKYKATYFRGEKSHGIVQTFNGDATEAELSVKLHALISNVVHFRDHMVKWGADHNTCRDPIESYFKSSLDYCILHDICNREKHGGVDRNGGLSRKAPKLREVHGALRLGGPANSESWVTLGPQGPVYGGNGTREVIISGTVIDRDGNEIGTIDSIIDRGVKHCEDAIKHFGVANAPA